MSFKPISIFGATDYFGNLVSLSEKTWNEHVLTEHPDMTGYEDLVKRVLQEPYEIRLSTMSRSGVAFVSEATVGPRPEGIRVLVNYCDTNFQKGASIGLIMTAYPVDLKIYSSPNLGATIYSKTGGTE